jgi:tetratricopeptide (TPR) repeat protein
MLAYAKGGVSIAGLLAAYRLEQAVKICKQFDVLGTTDTQNVLSCAWVYFRNNQPEMALKIIESQRKLASNPEYQLLVAYDYILKKQYDSARGILDSLNQQFKKKPLGLSTQEVYAEMYELQGQPDTAAFLYKQILSEDPKRIRAQWAMGKYYFKKGDVRRAQGHFEIVAQYWPLHFQSRFELAQLYLAQDNLKEAGIKLGECLRIEKNNAELFEQLGVYYEKKNNINEAIKYWQKALALKKDSTLAKEKLASHLEKVLDILLANKQYKQALAHLEKNAIALQTQPRFLYLRASVYKNLGKYEKALVDFQGYLNTNPKELKEVHQEMGVCYINIKLLDKALDSFSKALKAAPEDGSLHAWMAFSLEAKGEKRAAYEFWKRAVELIKDPVELQKASRKLANIEKKLNKKVEPE